jgi:MFS transporter, DHA3 family, macrolide efflux protein
MPWRNRNFLRLLSSQSVSTLGDYALTIALSITIFKRTGSAVDVALLYVVLILPAMAGLATGPWLERWPIKRILVGSDLVRAALTAIIPFALTSSLAVTYASVFLVTAFGVLFQSGRLSLIPEVVERDKLKAVNSIDQAAYFFSILIGLSVGGVLGGLDPKVAFWIDSATFVASAVLLCGLTAGREPLQRAVPPGVSYLQDLLAGYRYIWQHPVLSYNIYGNMLLNFGVGMFNSISVVFVFRQLHSDNIGYTALTIAETLGLTITGLLLARFADRSKGMLVITANAACGVFLIALGFSKNLAEAAVFFFLVGGTNVVGQATARTMLMERSSAEHRGKVMNARMALGRPVNTLGAVLAGALIDNASLSSGLVIAVSGVFVGAYGILGLGLVSIRNYDLAPSPEGAL